MAKETTKVAPAPMGRPPKNQCDNCRGYGERYHAQVAIEYYGNGEEITRVQTAPLHAKKCKPCKGSGIKGGKLREGDAPIIDMFKQGAPAPEPEPDNSQQEAPEADTEMPV